MIKAWIVVRKDKHVDDKFWVCFSKKDALKIAKDVSNYWQAEYKQSSDEVYKECRNDIIFMYDAESTFCVYVQPQKIREIGEDKE